MAACSPRGTSLARGLALGLGLVAVGCARADGPAGEGTPPALWLTLDSAPPQTSLPRARVVLSLEAPRELLPWSVEGAEHQVVPFQRNGSQRALRIAGGGLRKIIVPGPFEPTSFNRVVLRAVLGEPQLVAVAFARREEAAFGPPSVPCVPTESRLVFELPGILVETEPFDALWVTFQGPTSEVLVLGVDLEACPPTTYLPDPEAQAPIAVGADVRPGHALFTDRPREGSFVAPPGGRLELACGVPALARARGASPQLRVSLSAGGKLRREERIGLQDPPGGEARWRWVSIPLAGLEGERVRARFEVEDGAGAFVGCGLARPAVVTPDPDPRTVLLITSDTHRADHLGAADAGVAIRTPHLDELAARGLWFADSFSATNTTLPSHVALLTATHPRDTGIIGNENLLGDGALTLAERFHERGYTCLAAVSVLHLHPIACGLGQGFQRFSHPPGPYRGSREAQDTVDEVLRWLPELEGRPLFIWLHLFDAHSPYRPPEEFSSAYYPSDKRPDDESIAVPEGAQIPHWSKGVRDPAYIEALYRGEISYLDAQLGRLLEHPRIRSAVIAFTADHGESLGSHGDWFAHRFLYPETLRVPLILAWPGAPAGLRIERPVTNMDAGRTLLDLAGLADAGFPGSSLVPLSSSDAFPQTPRFALAGNGYAAAVEIGGWYLKLHLVDRTDAPAHERRELHQVELYHMESDPDCARDVADQEHRRAQRMRQVLVDFLASACDPGWRETAPLPDGEMTAHLRALGYFGGPVDRPARWFEPDCGCKWCEMFR